MRQELKVVDVLIIGGGIAGMTVALELSRLKPEAKILLVTRAADPNESNTRYAQGGIVARGGEDLVEDIGRAGDSIGLPAAARILADEGPRLVTQLLTKTVGVPFDEELALEGGHQLARVAKVADYTGRAIQEHLTAAVSKLANVEVITEVTAVDLLTLGHQSSRYQDKYKAETCVGIYGFDQQTGKVGRFLAKKTVLASGGCGQMFAFTTNPKGARGDGVAMAQRAGARLLGLEFIQFHPTALRLDGAPPFLISEAVRGLGAKLTDQRGRPFMDKYYPELDRPDLATRDKVSRAIFRQMLETGTDSVYLDLKSYIPRKKILEHFPVIHKTILTYGVDISRQLVPVSPAAHYSCGGVWTDLWGRTSIKNLYAVGEVACTGLHGGNRLASTSLLEGLVFGSRAARDIARRKLTQPWGKEKDIATWKDDGRLAADPALIAADMASIRNTMWNMVGLVRKTALLERAVADMTQLEETLTRFYRTAKLSDELLGLRNLALVALLTAKSALANPASSGCHYRA